MNEDLLSQFQIYYENAYPERPHATITELVCLNNGWESDVYAFTARWGTHQQEDLILRIYPGADALQKAAAEYQNLVKLAKLAYPVPRVDRLERDHSPFGKPFIIMERIHGGSLWGRMFHDPDQAQREQLLEQFCGLFVKLHTLDWHAGRPEEDIDPNTMFYQQMTRFQSYIDALPIPGFLPGWNWLLTRSRELKYGQIGFVHWDFHPENILLREEPEHAGEAMVIDWSGLEVSDTRLDLAWTLTLINAYEGSEWREAILQSYQRQLGQTVEQMDFFNAVAAFRRLYSVIGSLTFGADRLGMRPGAEAVMRKQAVHLKRVYEQFMILTQLSIPEVEQFLMDSGA